MRRFLSIALAATSVFISSKALAFDVVLTGGVALDLPSYRGFGTTNTTLTASKVTPGIGFTGGMFFWLPFARVFRFETGASLLNRSYDVTLDGTQLSQAFNQSYTEHFKMLHVPFLVRLGPPRWFSLGFGGYFARGLGDVKTTNNRTTIGNVPSTTPDTNNSYETEFYKRNDWGLEASLAIEIPMTKSFGILTDARYLYSLTDIGSTSAGAKIEFRDLLLLVGARFVF